MKIRTRPASLNLFKLSALFAALILFSGCHLLPVHHGGGHGHGHYSGYNHNSSYSHGVIMRSGRSHDY